MAGAGAGLAAAETLRWFEPGTPPSLYLIFGILTALAAFQDIAARTR
jgi:hypothetical protein